MDVSTIHSFYLYLWDVPWAVWNKGVKGRDRKRPWPPHHTRPSADGVNPPVLTAVVRAALDGLARNWVSGIYLSGLSSGPKIVEVISLIPVILLQCCCPLPPCKHGHKLFGPHTFFFYLLWLCFLHSSRRVMAGNSPLCCFPVLLHRVSKTHILSCCNLYLWKGKNAVGSMRAFQTAGCVFYYWPKHHTF